jgi:hypothetical protein
MWCLPAVHWLWLPITGEHSISVSLLQRYELKMKPPKEIYKKLGIWYVFGKNVLTRQGERFLFHGTTEVNEHG